MFSCPHCSASFPSIFLRDQHIQQYHRGGYPEVQQPTVGDSGKVELKALQHSLDAQREKLEKQRPISTPISAPRPHPDSLIPSNGWKKQSDNTYVFNEQVHQQITPFESTLSVVEAHLNSKHGNCIEHKYTKNLYELDRLKQKRIILDGKLSSHVPSDPQFKDIAKELYDTEQQIIKFNREVKPDSIHTLIFEDYYRYDLGTDEHTKWMKSFMDRTVSESERLAENYKKH